MCTSFCNTLVIRHVPLFPQVVYFLDSSATLPFRIQELTGTVLTRGLLTDIPSGSEFTLMVSVWAYYEHKPFHS